MLVALLERRLLLGRGVRPQARKAYQTVGPCSLTVMRQSVRGRLGSSSGAECSSEQLSQTTTSPTRYFGV